MDLNLEAGKHCQARSVMQSINSQYLHILQMNACMFYLQNCKSYILAVMLYLLCIYCADDYIEKYVVQQPVLKNPRCFVYGYFSRKIVNCTPINVSLDSVSTFCIFSVGLAVTKFPHRLIKST